MNGKLALQHGHLCAHGALLAQIEPFYEAAQILALERRRVVTVVEPGRVDRLRQREQPCLLIARQVGKAGRVRKPLAHGRAPSLDLIEPREELSKAKEAGLSCAEARAAGYSCADAKAIGYDLIDAKAAGWTTEELLNAGYINKALAMRLDAANSEAAKI